MNKVLVSGLINIETTLRIDTFPIEYCPVRYPFFGVNSSVSGVGYNVAKALATLGDEVRFLSIVGSDIAGKLVYLSLEADGISRHFILDLLAHTPQSVILYDQNGRRQINTDLKDVQKTEYPFELFHQALRDCSLAALCNVNFSRPFLSQARQAGKLIATDVHAISDLEDDYNRDFMAAAHLLFMSNEHLPVSPEEWVWKIWDRYEAPVVVIGLGERGAILGVRQDHAVERIPAVTTRPVVNTIGAGDALFSSFVHFYLKSNDPYQAIRKAMVFASYKIGETGAAQGFLDEQALNQLVENQPIS